MNCPLCDVKMFAIDSRPQGNTTHRKYECNECLTRYDTTEKINYDKLPRYILDKLHDIVERKGVHK